MKIDQLKMSDDEELEEFEISDYDLESAYNPMAKRHRQSKEEAIYGMWATTSRNTTTSQRKTSAYTRPVAFVSGGLKQSAKMPEKKIPTIKTKKESILLENYGDDDDENDSEEDLEKKKFKVDSDDENEEEENTIDLAGSTDDEDDEPPAPVVQNHSRQQTTHAVPVRDKDFGTFEKHTKGIGMKLLLKMGFEKGRGLGKNLQGRALPIQVVKRQGKGAVGSYGHEDPNMASKVQESTNENRVESKGQPQVPQWRKREVAGKTEYVYKTLDDLLKEQNSRFKKSIPNLPKEKIIDMTGREKRILNNYNSLRLPNEQQSTDGDENSRSTSYFSIPELTHNIDLLIDMTEQKLIRCDRRKKFDEDTIITLNYEKEKLEKKLNDEEKQISHLDELMGIIDRCEERFNSQDIHDPNDLFFLQTIFDELRRDFSKEYSQYHLSDLAVPVLHPYMKQYLSTWQPLSTSVSDNDELIELFSKWRAVLEDENDDITMISLSSMQNLDPYHRLLWEIWMPKVRQCILNWNPRESDKLIDFLEHWLPCIPLWILDNILDQLIIPRLQREVDLWNPLTDSIPIHSWIHPWLPLMKERLEPLYLPIRTKLAHALQNWQPSDSSAKAVLLPWKNVFKQGTWDAFMNKYIVPKLITTMQQFVIDPRQQRIEQWNWILSWHEMIPLASMIALLERSFFPKWLQVLNAWLNTTPNYNEIHRWYSGWRSLIPSTLISHPTIKEKLTEGLDMIDRSLSHLSSGNLPPSTQQPQSVSNLDYEAILNRGVASSSSTIIHSFKDLVEKKCSEHNILFLPVTNRYYEGKQVYRCGNVNAYIDKNVLFLWENGHWVPTPLDSLANKTF
ncbi:unnamed protein product [Didymodactylos carnosus]|uniref:G-patch domain-containing protein n=1 Tax=Didymodactylos carnosus TaxID=1234261 RepID=A0A813Z242_9BILA|nr:unnamed protein product [Didymodactylos carnosus]CAF0892091.1 unnamed protein product [Didymodactylos carnosus]CAF3497649.1 unnamed protein product [Didymodactylos carnosus]CAF3676154.1 unnamed protein product [Didymodactylos carnosus]